MTIWMLFADIHTLALMSDVLVRSTEMGLSILEYSELVLNVLRTQYVSQ